MQGFRCAYCEASINDGCSHIEHFVPKSRDPRQTFEWPNLFWSCNRHDSCGRHKDHQVRHYNPADLIKPDVDDPNDYFVFIYDGTIRVRDDIEPVLKHRATETLRVLNLDANNGALRHMRRMAVAGYLQNAETLWKLREQLAENEWNELLSEELESVQALPFIATIRHTLTGAHGNPSQARPSC